MRCAQCGADLITGDRHCGRCGAPVPMPIGESGEDTITLVRGVPVSPQAPSVYGPPIGPETRMGMTEIMEIEQPPDRQILGYRPFVPPPPPSQRRRSGCLRIAAITAVVLILALLATDIVAHGNIQFFGLGAHPSATAISTRSAANCVAQPTKPAASQALVHAQLTSGLRDVATKDYRPVNTVTTIHAGQKIYLTFQIATNKAGTVGAEFCTKSEKLPGTLVVPAKSNGRYAEFEAIFTSADVGTSVATLTWNGVVAATKTFTIKP